MKTNIKFLALVIVLLSCRYTMHISELDVDKIAKIQLLRDWTVLAESTDVQKIKVFAGKIKHAAKDTSSNNFKSKYFINFKISDNDSILISVQSNKFRYMGKRYEIQEEIISYFEKYFGKK